ncbi:tudor domain-containing protein 7A isoform X1 [Periophthalmus magnuspinnatus]|uniref:tudor domain-containing protein 7A isoform X1 n=1 Tax=Periophthalmus magnuspinnatus TaxID=409849 RepID=UPI0024363FA4|nr:tudor domain-containing protein 7A isoform X1 [Periophthalmus magnuspinnatus]
MADSESIKKMLRSVLQSSKNGVNISSLQADYKSLCGEAIPLKRLGFSNLEDYLRSIPSVVRLESRQGFLVCFATVCKETAHIAELVARQKNSKKAGRSQVVNCKMRFKPSNPYALSVKPKASLRQPSNCSNRTINRQPAQGSGGFSASGDVRKQDPRRSSVISVYQRPPVVNQRPPVKSPTQEMASTQANKDDIVQINPNDFNLELEQSRLSQVLNKYKNGLWMSKLPAVYNNIFNRPPHPRTLLELEKWTHICSLEKPSITNRADCLIYPPLPPPTYRNTNGPDVSPNSPASTPLSSRSSTPEKAPAPVPKIYMAKPTFVFPPGAIGDGLHMVSSPIPALVPHFINSDFGDGPNLPAAQISCSSSASFLQPSPDIHTLSKAIFNTKSDLSPQTPKAASASTISENVRQKVKELLFKYSSGLWVQAVPKIFEDTYKMPLPEHALDDLSLWLDICSVEYPFPNDKKKAILYYSGRGDSKTTEEQAHPLPSGLEVVGATAPPRLAFPSEQYPSVLVTDAKGSNAVTVRYVGKNYSNAQEAMEEAMCSFYSKRLTGYSLSKVTIGQLVAAREDEDVARAQVMEVINPQKVKVYYLDYGCSLETSAHNLRELHQDFLSLPFQAINVKLAGLEHFSSHPSVLSIFEKLAIGKILLMETLEPCQHNDTPLVVLYDTSEAEDLNINSACLKVLQDETMNNPLTINVTYQDVSVTNVCADGIIYCQLPSRGMARLMKLLEQTEAFFKTQVTSESLVSSPFTGKLCLARYKGKWSRVEVANIYGNRVLETLFIDFGVTVTIEVTELREIPPLLLKDFIIIPPQAIRCRLEDVQVPEGGWSPEAVKWVKKVVLGAEAAKMTIRKLDYHKGNRLVYMHLFLGVDGLEVENSVNHQLVQSELYQKHINNKTDTGLSALVERLTIKTSVPFANTHQATTVGLEKEGLSVKCTSPKMDSLSMPPLLDLPQMGQNMDVFVPVACHPGYFVLQPWQDLHKLVVLMGEMVLYYNKTSKTSSQTEIKKAEVYAAKIDKNWHRVLVKGILSNGLISIYELDHGKHELVRSTAIQPLIEQFRQLPFQAITAQLAGLSRLQWSEEASIVFRNHVEKRALVAQVDSVQEAPDVRAAPWERRLTVYLVDTTMEDRDLWIHTVMADIGGELTMAA